MSDTLRTKSPDTLHSTLPETSTRALDPRSVRGLAAPGSMEILYKTATAAAALFLLVSAF